ncbi:recombinase family protein [Streptomyces sp. NPDC059352]|uniref:recombinase family protein n=1 Tax=Streptomyces sp. NPDC059352 TaxID=3346810 RepID=UPI0036AA505E
MIQDLTAEKRTLLTAIDAVIGVASPGQLRAVAYLRVSTEEQATGHGITYTGKRAVRHIAKKGWAFVGVFADEGFSGTLDHTQRPDLGELMSLARQTPRPFDLVAVYEERAIGRAGRAFWPWVWELEDLGVFVAIVRGDYDNTTDDGRSRMRKAQDRAEDERIVIRDRTNAGRDERALDGGYVGGIVPFGYRVEGPPRARVLVVDESPAGSGPRPGFEADCLRRARAIFVDPRQGARNWRKTAILVNGEGYTNRAGDPWAEGNLKARVMSPVVLDAKRVFRNPESPDTALDREGNPVFGETVTIALPAIFAAEEVEELRRADMQRPIRAKGPGGRVYTVSKRLISLCGSHYVGFGREGESRHYRCSGKNEKFAGAGYCACPQVDAESVEKYVWEQVCCFLGDEERLKVLVDQHVSFVSAGKVDFATRIEDLDRKASSLKRTIAVTNTMLVRQAIESGASDAEAEAEVTAALQPLRKELAEVEALRAEASAWEKETLDATERAQDVRSLARHARHRLTQLSLERQAEFLELLDIKATIVGAVPTARRGTPCTLTAWLSVRGRGVPVLSDEAWAAVSLVIPARFTGRNPRRALDGVLHKVRTGCRWKQLPREYGHYGAVQGQLHRWRTSGVMEEVLEALVNFPSTPLVLEDLTPPLKLTGTLIPELLLGLDPHFAEPSRRPRLPGRGVRAAWLTPSMIA